MYLHGLECGFEVYILLFQVEVFVSTILEVKCLLSASVTVLSSYKVQTVTSAMAGILLLSAKYRQVGPQISRHEF